MKAVPLGLAIFCVAEKTGGKSHYSDFLVLMHMVVLHMKGLRKMKPTELAKLGNTLLPDDRQVFKKQRKDDGVVDEEDFEPDDYALEEATQKAQTEETDKKFQKHFAEDMSEAGMCLLVSDKVGPGSWGLGSQDADANALLHSRVMSGGFVSFPHSHVV